MLTAYRSTCAFGEPTGALLFSCVGRGTALYKQPDHDTNAFKRLIAEVPIGGLFCAGEIGPVHNATYLHAFTSVFAVFHRRL